MTGETTTPICERCGEFLPSSNSKTARRCKACKHRTLPGHQRLVAKCILVTILLQAIIVGVFLLISIELQSNPNPDSTFLSLLLILAGPGVVPATIIGFIVPLPYLAIVVAFLPAVVNEYLTFVILHKHPSRVSVFLLSLGTTLWSAVGLWATVIADGNLV